jgi:WD40 repeat protein
VGNNKYIIVLIGFLLSLLVLITACASFASSINPISNDDYKVILKKDSDLQITDLSTNKVFNFKVDFTVDHIEINTKYPILYVFGYKESNKPWSRFHYLYFLRENKFINLKEISPVAVKRWSRDGKYTYLMKADNEFIIIETKSLEDYLNESSDVLEHCAIKGHPLGSISQIEWSDGYLMYSSGCCESACLGILDVNLKMNYFLTCCDMTIKEYSKPCSDLFKDTDKLFENSISRIKDKKLQSISSNFHQSVSEIIKSIGSK